MLLTVSDTGIGMEPEILRRAIEPFFTTKEVGRGSGLGLSMVYGFVKQSGGHIDISSVPGKGTVVRIYLPVAQAAAAKPPIPVLAREGAARRLARQGYHPRRRRPVRRSGVGGNPASGYGLCRLRSGGRRRGARHLAERREIDLIFTDLVMPRMGGVELADKARVLCVPAFASSSPRAMLARMTRRWLSGSEAFIGKPFHATISPARCAASSTSRRERWWRRSPRPVERAGLALRWFASAQPRIVRE